MAPKTAEPLAAKGLRRDYELFLASTPDLRRYTTHMQPTMWANRETFTGRLPRLGPLVSSQFLRAAKSTCVSHSAPTDGSAASYGDTSRVTRQADIPTNASRRPERNPVP